MKLSFKTEIITLDGNIRHSDKMNADYYKISMLTADGLAGNLNCTEEVYNAVKSLGMGVKSIITCEFCDDYESISFKVVAVRPVESPKKSEQTKGAEK